MEVVKIDEYAGAYRRADTSRWCSASSVWTTGSLGLDFILGRGDDGEYGMPRGTLVEAFGPPDVGKSSFALMLVGRVIADGGAALWVDADGKFNRFFASTVGVKISELDFTNETRIGELLPAVERRLDEYDLVVIDPIVALCTEEEAASTLGNMPDERGFYYQLGRSLTLLRQRISGKRATVLMLNQIRNDPTNGFGYHAAMPTVVRENVQLRIEISRKQTFSRATESSFGYRRDGHRVEFEILKNDRFMPHGKRQLTIWYDTGFDLVRERLELLVEQGLVAPDGSRFRWLTTAEDARHAHTRAEIYEQISALGGSVDRLILQRLSERELWYLGYDTGDDLYNAFPDREAVAGER